MIIETDVGSVRVVIRSDDAADVSHVGDAGKLLDAPPVLAAVFGNVHETVVSADVKQSFLLLRFGDRGGVTEKRGRRVLRHRINAPNPAHHRQLITIELARELAAND